MLGSHRLQGQLKKVTHITSTACFQHSFLQKSIFKVPLGEGDATVEGSVTEWGIGNISQIQLNIRALVYVVVKRLTVITAYIRTGVLSRSTRDSLKSI